MTEEPVQILCNFWRDQQAAITYQELREAVIDGAIDNDTLNLWQQDYSVLVATQMSKLWNNAIMHGPAGQPILDKVPFEFNTQSQGILNWIRNRGAEFVTASTQEQKDAIAALLTKKMRDGHTVDELSRLIRPCIGLTEGDAKAATRFYDNIVATLKKEHPRMKTENIRKKALDATSKYAERKHRQRAMTIAQTESAFAYNRGADEGIRQAQSGGYLGAVKKRWCTSGDDMVCDMCASLEGVEVGMDYNFDITGRELFDSQHMLPPAHPRCACAVEYIEVSPPAYTDDIPQMKVNIMETDSFREYSEEEIRSIAEQTEDIASKHLSIPSKWSGSMLISGSGIQTSNGQAAYYAKLWNCDILTAYETSPAVILHEQIHARSISYYGQEIYIKYCKIEEATVQLVVEEICKKENIEIVSSAYDGYVNTLREIGRRIGIYETDYEFSKNLIEIPVPDRLTWLSDNLYDILRKDPNATVQEYQKFSEMLNTLY